eukprot:scaffold30597_cov28-Tisochrysis_lutea.AAC.4
MVQSQVRGMVSRQDRGLAAEGESPSAATWLTPFGPMRTRNHPAVQGQLDAPGTQVQARTSKREERSLFPLRKSTATWGATRSKEPLCYLSQIVARLNDDRIGGDGRCKSAVVLVDSCTCGTINLRELIFRHSSRRRRGRRTGAESNRYR